MAKKAKPADGAARALWHGGQDARPIPPASPAQAAPCPDTAWLHRTLPSRQRFARACLAGEAAGAQQRLAPDAQVSPTEGIVEDDETVERLVRWRQEAPYG